MHEAIDTFVQENLVQNEHKPGADLKVPNWPDVRQFYCSIQLQPANLLL